MLEVGINNISVCLDFFSDNFKQIVQILPQFKQSMTNYSAVLLHSDFLLFKTSMCSENSILSMHFSCYFQLFNHLSKNGTLKKPY